MLRYVYLLLLFILPFNVSADDEFDVVVADFGDATQDILAELRPLNGQFIYLDQVISNQEEAEEIALTYGARFITWGEEIPDGIRVNLLFIAECDCPNYQQRVDIIEDDAFLSTMIPLVAEAVLMDKDLDFEVAINSLLISIMGDMNAQSQETNLVDFGIEAYVTGNYELSIEYYTRAMDAAPEAGYIYDNRGLSYDALGETENALADFNRAIELDSILIAAYVNRGWIYHKIGEYENAIADFERAIELDSHYYKAYIGRAYMYYLAEEYEQAIDYYTTALELNSEENVGYFYRGKSYHLLGQYELAIDDFTAYIAIDPNDVFGFYSRGLVYYDMDLHDLALKDFYSVIEIDPSFYYVYHSIGSSYYMQGDYEVALENFHIYLSFDDASLSEDMQSIVDWLEENYGEE